MNRKKELERAFQRGHLLNLKNKFYREWISRFIIDEVRADIGAGDLTTDAIIKNGRVVEGAVISRGEGILAGVEEAIFLYRKNRIQVNQLKLDGSRIKNGDKILKLKGKEKDLLEIERSALDILQRMSGIATLTGRMIKKLAGGCMISPTRKTYWRYLDKKAVYLGGGLTHRLALWDAILIKDNHFAALRNEKEEEVIKEAINRASKKLKKANFIEVEVSNKSEAIAASYYLKKFNFKIPCLIMFDNMNPKEIRQSINELKDKGLYEHVLFEASGGINPSNIKDYSKTGVDVVSLGYLTHAPWIVDIKQAIL